MRYLIFLLLCLPQLVFGVKVSLQVGRTKVGTRDRFVVRVTATSSSGNRGYFKLTTGNNFMVVSGSTSQNFSFSYSTGGATVQKRQYTRDYILTARRPGVYTIGPCFYTVDGRRYRSNAVRLRVVSGSTGTQSRFKRQRFPFGFRGFESPDDDDEPVNIRVRTSLSVKRPYVSQETVLYLDVLASRSAVFRIRPVLPALPGFWVERFKKLPTEEPVQINYRGKKWYRYRYHLARLYPARPGVLKIDGVKGIIRTRGFFSRGSRFTTEPGQLTARSIPAGGRPTGYSGVVGKFSITMDPLQDTVFAKEPFHLTIRVQGRGLLQTITKLKKVAPDGLFRILSPRIDTASDNARDSNGKERSFTYTIYPQKSGELSLPVFSLTFFDPVEGRYITVATKKQKLKVAVSRDTDPDDPGSGGSGRSRPLVFSRDSSYSGKSVQPFSFKVFFIILIAFVVITPLNILFVRRRDALLADPDKMKRLNAWSRAKVFYNAAMNSLKRGDTDTALGNLEKSLRGFVADRGGRSGHNIPYSVLEQVMHEAGISSDIVQEYLEVCQECGTLRYGTAADAGIVGDLLNRGKNVLAKLKKEWS